jgi:hypothetical protein
MLHESFYRYNWIETAHVLTSMVSPALSSGAVAVGDGRLQGWWFKGYSCRGVQDSAHRLFLAGLLLLLATGIFMACSGLRLQQQGVGLGYRGYRGYRGDWGG